MDLVIDTSAVIAVLVNEPARPAIEAATIGATLLAPASVPWEVGNAMVSLLRRRKATIEMVRAALRDFSAVPLRLIAVDLVRSADLARDASLYAYDAYVLEAARARRCPLLTLDRRLLSAAAQLGISRVEIG